MSGKCLVIVGSLCFCLLTLALFTYIKNTKICRPYSPQSGITMSFPTVPEVVCNLYSAYEDEYVSLESFLQASTTNKDQDLRLSGLAVLSRLANASQPLVDVSKSRIHVDKIALVTPKDDIAFSCGDLTLNAQNAGYSVVTYFGDGYCGQDGNVTKPHTQEEILIPIVFVHSCINHSTSDSYNPVYDYDFLKNAQKTFVNIIKTKQWPDELKQMAKYLDKLYYWFLLGPIITLVWLRRKKKLCCVTISQQVDEESAAGNEESTRLVTRVEESQQDNAGVIQDITGGENENESQPLIVTIDTGTDLTERDNLRNNSITKRVARIFGRGIRYFVVCLCYVIVTLAALPVGISSGGWSFFRFDEREMYRPTNFWEGLIKYFRKTTNMSLDFKVVYMSCALTAWWPCFQIFCFFMYSMFDCASTWTVLTNVSKLIRSDWFSSNMYLLALCAIVPYCSLSDQPLSQQFFYFTVYNILCTVCNFLFIIILNKHKVVTRYVFYISVCMICAYVESDIVAVFYFILNSQGSLSNLKLTALRTAALGLTLTLSFSSSMHIIRKIMKPQESVFEGLAEK